MKFRIKSLIIRVLPQSVANTLRVLLLNLPRKLEKRRTQRIFAAATDEPSYLDISVLETLQMKYPPQPKYGYDAYAVEDRGIEEPPKFSICQEHRGHILFSNSDVGTEW